MPLTTNIKVDLTANETGSLDLAQRSANHSLSFAKQLVSGTGNGQADVIWSDTRTLAASANEDLDLAGTLAGAFGNSVFVRVKALIVTADAGNTNNVVVGGAAATQWVGPFGAATHTLAIQPGNGFCITASGATGWAVGAGASDLLRIANSGAGTPVTYSIVVVGASA